jgi:hypothetical protein
MHLAEKMMMSIYILPLLEVLPELQATLRLEVVTTVNIKTAVS